MNPLLLLLLHNRQGSRSLTCLNQKKKKHIVTIWCAAGTLVLLVRARCRCHCHCFWLVLARPTTAPRAHTCHASNILFVDVCCVPARRAGRQASRHSCLARSTSNYIWNIIWNGRIVCTCFNHGHNHMLDENETHTHTSVGRFGVAKPAAASF